MGYRSFQLQPMYESVTSEKTDLGEPCKFEKTTPDNIFASTGQNLEAPLVPSVEHDKTD